MEYSYTQRNGRPDIKQILLYSLAVILAAQMSYSVSYEGFVISGGIIPLAVFLFMVDSFPFITVLMISSSGILLTRILSSFLIASPSVSALGSHLPEFLFYIVYGLLLYIYYKLIRSHLPNDLFFILLFLPDYIANSAELFLRTGSVFTYKYQLGIVIAAAARTLLIWILTTRLEPFSFSLLRKEHAERYEHLLLLNSALQSEEIWMNKNTLQIEQTMNSAYKLYNEMQAAETDQEYTKSVLSIAAGIHEIKKEYVLVLRGISEALKENSETGGMYLKDILQILTDTFTRECEAQKRKLTITTSLSENIYTSKQYPLISVFRNLIQNAIEAADSPVIKIDISQEASTNDTVSLIITDHGPGIDAKRLNDIFRPGFSTRINYQTGEISRGLGLPLVRSIVEEQLNGSIRADSNSAETVFTITIDRKKLEEKDENLSSR